MKVSSYINVSATQIIPFVVSLRRQRPNHGLRIRYLCSQVIIQTSAIMLNIRTDLGGFCSPIIIYDGSGELKPGMRNEVAQQIDIMPTVLGILGYDKPYLSFGCDLLNTPTNNAYAVNYLNGIYQYVKYNYVLQFDGEKTKAIYSLDDLLMKHNLVGKVPQQQQMEKEVKAIIQQYMTRMNNNRLIPQK